MNDPAGDGPAHSDRADATPTHDGRAFGAPGIEPTWSSSDKDLVGTALGPARLWYTLGHGVLNEVYHPRIDIPQIRDLGFIVADDAGFWVELKRLPGVGIALPAPGVPLPEIHFRHARFHLRLRLCPDSERDVLRLSVKLEGDPALRPWVLLAPHLGGRGHDNVAEAAIHRGRRMLWAEQGSFGLALAAVDPTYEDAYGRTSAGYVGASDAWQDFHRHGRMRWRFAHAGPGNVALAGELTRHSELALGLATSKEAAATLALAALAQPFDTLLAEQRAAWDAWHRAREARVPPPDLPAPLRAQYRTSAMVLKCHRDKTFTGAMVASLSVPWGNRQVAPTGHAEGTDETRGGYHLVWPRDLVESATALLALGGADEARNVLRYLIATQQADGHWHQNQWLGGKPYWTGTQLDEAAFPILLAAALAERDALDDTPVAGMVRRALGFLIREGPASPQDRWEENAGVNAFTLAAAIAALVAGAALLPPDELADDDAIARQVADFWNARIEDWTVARDTALGRRHGVPAYYVRIAPPSIVAHPGDLGRALPIRNRADGAEPPGDEQLALDFLQLVRLGLRRADDPLIRDSVRLADALLQRDTPSGPVWHRYTGDGYGEHADGRPYDGTGIGRGWPLLVGERGHHALAAGEDALPYLATMNAMAGGIGLLPEQVWDRDAIPARHLFPGRPTGSAMPLAWAHAEFVKLAASRARGHAIDRPEVVWRRYAGVRPDPAVWVWTPGAPIAALPTGKDLLLLFPDPVTLHLGFDAWQGTHERDTRAAGLGLHAVTLPAGELAGHACIDLTWRRQGRWIGEDFRIRLDPPAFP